MSTTVMPTETLNITESSDAIQRLTVSPENGPAHWDITVAEGAAAHFLLITDFSDKESASDVTVSVTLGNNASISLASYTTNAASGNRQETFKITLGEASHFQGALLTTQCQTSRIHATAEFRGENADCNFAGLTVVGDSAVAETDTVMNHHLPENTSRQLFKNIVNGAAQTSYTGLVFVEQHAQKTDSEQSNQNILLSDQARSIAQPQLRIHADDVIAAHGSTTGQLDEEAVFYLQSRGFSIPEARRTLLFGFADDLLSHVDHADIQAELESEIHKALEQVLEHVDG